MPIWVIYAFLASVSAALVGIFSKVGIKNIDSTVATAIRGFVIALSMGLTALVLGKWETLAVTSLRSILFIVLAGIFGGLSWLWGFLALQAGGDVTAVNAIDRMSIILIFVFAYFFLSEQFTVQKLVGVLFVAIGVVLVTMSRTQLIGLFTQLWK